MGRIAARMEERYHQANQESEKREEGFEEVDQRCREAN